MVDQLHCMLWLPVILIWVVDRHYYVWIRQIRNSRPKRRCIYRMLLHQVKITIPRSTVFCCASFGLVQGQCRLVGEIISLNLKPHESINNERSWKDKSVLRTIMIRGVTGTKFKFFLDWYIDWFKLMLWLAEVMYNLHYLKQ